MLKKYFFGTVVLFLLSLTQFQLYSESVINGSISIPVEELRQESAIPLSGEWQFFWQQFISDDSSGGISSLVNVPGNWASDKKFPAAGYGSYKLALKGLDAGRIYSLYIPEMISAYRLFINGKELCSNGSPGTSRETTTPRFLPKTVEFVAMESSNVIHIQVSNFNYRKSGIWRNLYIGSPQVIHRLQQKRMLLDMFLVGILIFISTYHISLYLFRSEEKAELFFGLICLVMAVRILSTGEQLLTYYMPAIPWEIIRKLEFSPFPLSSALAPLFIYSLFPEESNLKFIKGILALSFLTGAVFFILPVRISNLFIIPAEIFILFVIFYVLFIIIRAIRNKRIGSLLIMSAMVIMVLSIVNDLLYSNQIISSFYITPFGFILFIVIQAMMLSKRYAHSFKTIENLTQNLKTFNTSLSRFVPFQFLHFLKKESILEVNLGDQVNEEMTILFADIRSFTTLSEDMTPEENFRFLNSFLSNVVPVIREEGGFVDKFIGDGIMALFPESPDHALRAAICLQEAVRKYNKNRDKAGYRHIQIGIGLHSGSIMLGTIGEHDRMETTVISDTVNIASRMEQMTKTFGSSIIISHQMYDLMKDHSEFETRNLGPVIVKGKKKKMGLYEILNGLTESDADKKITTRDLFEKALELFLNKNYESALDNFQKVLSEDSEDRGAAYYIERCREVLE